MTRGVRNGAHESREQMTRDVRGDDHFLLDDGGPLPNIPPRPGYTQRWVRVAQGIHADPRNLSTRARRGWQPRPADTVPQDLQFMLVQNASMGNVIGTHDVVLMERPIEIQKRAEAIERQKRRDLEVAVRSNLFREHNQMGGAKSGITMGPNDVESSARVERGVPHIADD